MLDRETSSRGVPVSSCSLTRSRREARLTAKNGNYPGALLHRHYFAQALSPDGRTLAFLRVQTHSPPWARFVKLLPNGEIVQLTRAATRKMHPVCSPQMARASLTRFPESGQLFRHRVNPPQSPGPPEAGSGMYVEDLHGRMVGATWTSVATPSSKCGVSQPPDC